MLLDKMLLVLDMFARQQKTGGDCEWTFEDACF